MLNIWECYKLQKLFLIFKVHDAKIKGTKWTATLVNDRNQIISYSFNYAKDTHITALLRAFFFLLCIVTPPPPSHSEIPFSCKEG